jgi:hypothetical protein
MSFQPQDSEYLENLLASSGNPQQEVEGYLSTNIPPVTFQNINYNAAPVFATGSAL